MRRPVGDHNLFRDELRMENRWIAVTLAIGVAALFGSAGATESPYSTSQNGRFAILETLRQEAVLDLRTQLIWERSPNPTEVTWSTAHTRCSLKTVGGQTGWRLPSFIELMTLVEPIPQQAPIVPTLPVGHPFQGVKAGAYWTSDSPSSEPKHAYTVDLLRADVATHEKNRTNPLWCVRGGTHEQQPQSPAIKPPGLI
jgi:Protein of unknown function (DUF1566)